MSKEMTAGEAIKRINEFALHHAIQELPNSARTVEAFEMAITALEVVSKIVTCDECKNRYDEDAEHYCNGCFREDDFFCADGKRKQEQ